jgi:hypothetical protein
MGCPPGDCSVVLTLVSISLEKLPPGKPMNFTIARLSGSIVTRTSAGFSVLRYFFFTPSK